MAAANPDRTRTAKARAAAANPDRTRTAKAHAAAANPDRTRTDSGFCAPIRVRFLEFVVLFQIDRPI
ncbi:hypothetical protein DLREEDagr8_03020 [Dongia sp. agr-C8]